MYLNTIPKIRTTSFYPNNGSFYKGDSGVITISVIIPVYNVEAYIEECVKSVIQYPGKDIEIILIDDGSTDRSGSICDQWQRADSRIKVIHKSNGGLSDARNAGMKIAKGTYYFFLDSDDFIMDSKDFKKIILHLRKQKPEIIILNSKKVYNGIYEKRSKFGSTEDKFVEIPILEAISAGFYHACAWNKIVRADILNEHRILFPEGRLSEDMEYCGLLLDYIDKATVYYKPVYAYRIRKESISNSVNDKHLCDIYAIISSAAGQQQPLLKKNFFSYEYAVLLANSSLSNSDLIKKILALEELLNYGVRNKVKAVNCIRKVLGIKATRIILIFFLRFKNFKKALYKYEK
ncbi:glycosyltransferase family 2 protein [Lachnospiraceae bacterium]|nr:glycosyltransferase family 2 protein [Lachnospiraceae bacterium]